MDESGMREMIFTDIENFLTQRFNGYLEGAGRQDDFVKTVMEVLTAIDGVDTTDSNDVELLTTLHLVTLLHFITTFSNMETTEEKEQYKQLNLVLMTFYAAITETIKNVEEN